jgi:uncharacterized protein involved in type VI secretion and phage assembly
VALIAAGTPSLPPQARTAAGQRQQQRRSRGRRSHGKANPDNLTADGMFTQVKPGQARGDRQWKAPFDGGAIPPTVQSVDREEES